MRSYLAIAVLLLAVQVVLLAGASAQDSTTYSMRYTSVAGGGDTSSSGNYENEVIVSQESPTGVTSFCNSGFVNSLGFWTIPGDVSAAPQLFVMQSPGSPQDVELFWTGQAETFAVYRGLDPMNVVVPTNLIAVPTTCFEFDDQAPTSGVVFYNVIPVP